MNKKTVVDFRVVTLAEENIITNRKLRVNTEANKRGHNLGSWKAVQSTPSKLIARCTNPNCVAEGLVDRAESVFSDAPGGACFNKCPLTRKQRGLD